MHERGRSTRVRRRSRTLLLREANGRVCHDDDDDDDGGGDEDDDDMFLLFVKVNTCSRC